MFKKIYPNINRIAEEIAGGLIGAGGSLVGSTIGAISQHYTNQANKEIAEMNNKAMLQAMREQTRADQTYNSASEQMKRLQIAGLNPMSLAGQSPTPVSASGVPNLDSPVMQNPFGEFDLGTNQLGSAMIQSASLDNQSRSIDVADFSSKVDMLKTIGDLSRDTNLTSDDVRNIVSSVMGNDNPYSSGLQDLVKDNHVVNRLNNEIKSSNLSVKEKEYLFGWLDEFTNAEYLSMLADIENKQTSSNLNRSSISLQRTQETVNRAIASLTNERKNEVTQAIANMKEQWKSLNFQGELDAIKLKRATELADNLVDKISYETKLSKSQAKSFVWRECIYPVVSDIFGLAGDLMKSDF